jgi:hypothetical protein
MIILRKGIPTPGRPCLDTRLSVTRPCAGASRPSGFRPTVSKLIETRSDAVARDEWNMALAASVTPVLHLAEVAFRNAIYAAGAETTARRTLKWRLVPCWLDATPSLLEPREERDVFEAVLRLGKNSQRHTPGHLVAQLGFGFWLRLCNRPYEHGRLSGPTTLARRYQAIPPLSSQLPKPHGHQSGFRRSARLPQPGCTPSPDLGPQPARPTSGRSFAAEVDEPEPR